LIEQQPVGAYRIRPRRAPSIHIDEQQRSQRLRCKRRGTMARIVVCAAHERSLYPLGRYLHRVSAGEDFFPSGG
jgi:hypothetical protein